MKRFHKLLLAFVLANLLLLPAFPASAASASLSGPSAVRQGETLTLTFTVSGSGVDGGLLGLTGKLSFDPGQLTFTGGTSALSGWSAEFNPSGGNIAVIAMNDNLNAPVTGSSALFRVTFQVNAGAGRGITVGCSSLVGSGGGGDVSLSGGSYSVTVAQTLSSNNRLASLSLSAGALSPAFSPETTSYTAGVDYGVSKITVTAKAQDGGAQVSVSSPALKAGSTTKVTVTVKAPDGSSRTYTVSVKRAADPSAAGQTASVPTDSSSPDAPTDSSSLNSSVSSSDSGLDLDGSSSGSSSSQSSGGGWISAHTLAVLGRVLALVLCLGIGFVGGFFVGDRRRGKR